MHHYSLRRFLVLLVPLLLTGVALAALLLFSLAHAQEAAPTVGTYTVPDYVWTIGSLAIGWLVKEISSPLTALLKARFGFEGNVTRVVYLVLSVLFVGLVGAVTGAFGQGAAGWSAAAGAVAIAFLKGLGDYAKLQQATMTPLLANLQLRPQPRLVGDHVLYRAPQPGLEPVHSSTGELLGYTHPLTPLAS